MTDRAETRAETRAEISAEIAQRLTKPEFPRSARYAPDWMLRHQMGPNALWLTEWLTDSADGGLDLEAGSRVLDLGCGKAMSSIFVAKEYRAQVFAADLWMSPGGNAKRAEEAGVGDRVHPIRAEAHSLPFAESFFDAVVSVDAYHYFGTDELYLHYLATRVRPGGQIGVVVPGLVRSFEEGESEGDVLVDGVPERLGSPQKNGKVFWEPACWSIKTQDFWRSLWQRCPWVEDVSCDLLEDGCRHWLDFEHALVDSGAATYPSDVEALERDGGRYLGFVRITAKRSKEAAIDLYDPDLGRKVGIDE